MWYCHFYWSKWSEYFSSPTDPLKYLFGFGFHSQITVCRRLRSEWEFRRSDVRCLCCSTHCRLMDYNGYWISSPYFALVPGLRLLSAAGRDLLVLGFDLGYDLLHVQAATVVHLHHHRGVFDAGLQLTQLLVQETKQQRHRVYHPVCPQVMRQTQIIFSDYIGSTSYKDMLNRTLWGDFWDIKWQFVWRFRQKEAKILFNVLLNSILLWLFAWERIFHLGYLL